MKEKKLIMIIEFSNDFLFYIFIKNILVSVTPAECIVTRFISFKNIKPIFNKKKTIYIIIHLHYK